MSAIDSRTMIVQYDVPICVSSEPQDSEWGQPPASHYDFTIVGNRLLGQSIAGVYPPSPSSDELNDLALLELESAEASFRQGWQEAQSGQTRPVSELWDGIDAE